jgi:hypothetical protein
LAFVIWNLELKRSEIFGLHTPCIPLCILGAGLAKIKLINHKLQRKHQNIPIKQELINVLMKFLFTALFTF